MDKSFLIGQQIEFIRAKNTLDPILKLYDSIEAFIGEGFQDGAAGLLSKAGHPVAVTAVLAARGEVHRISRVDRRVHVKIVVWPQQDPAPVAYGYRVGDVLGVGDVKEAGGHPGNQVLQDSFEHIIFVSVNMQYVIVSSRFLKCVHTGHKVKIRNLSELDRGIICVY